ncbi:N-acetylneuraminate synthase family protein, partial [Candidatus Pelagibacter sp.]|nr:N-acetylneuraminate synthase family protein [Candidatus Pelagibacter sp.]
MINSKSVFHNLFVLELANNHLGSIVRGKKIISDYGQVVRFNNIKAAIKLQFRDVENFIHEKYKELDERYIKKTLKTKLSKSEYKELSDHIIKNGCIPMATPFDEASVDLCVEFNFPIIKIASSDCNDWPLIEKIASTKKPVIISTGGVSEKDLDDVVTYFNKRSIDLAINHCVSLYPSDD